MAARRRENRALLAWSLAVTLAAAALFYGRGLSACAGDWPAPLDDVYIHFDFARAWATGHPFEWIAGQGYSSGETSPAYALVLAVGYLVGFRGDRLSLWGAGIALMSLVVMMHGLARIADASFGRRAHAHLPSRALVLLIAPLMLAIGTLDFHWFSGMELPLFGAALSQLMVAAFEARSTRASARAGTRAHLQWRTGILGACLVLVRPEAAVVVAVASFVVARRPGALSPLAAIVRVAAPGALVTVLVAGMNYLGTGHVASAGALLKLLSGNPFLTDLERAREYLVNVALFGQAMRQDLGTSTGELASPLLALALASLLSRRTRGLGVLALGSALTFVLLVSWNGAARHQSFRHYMPAVVLFLFACTLGLAALAGARHPLLRVTGALLALVGIGLAASHLGESSDLYARASRNIHDQQRAVGRRRNASTPEDAIVLVGDAGAIPYFSKRHAVDALGLGGYHGVPFVSAAVQGEAATLELIERLPPIERPTVLALYANWFPGITARFGHLREQVTITDNVICGGVTKGIYDADWSAMTSEARDEHAPQDALDELDVADVVSEEAHAYVSAAPEGGWTLFDVRSEAGGRARFDAGRLVPEGREESFTARARVPEGGLIVLRVDESPCDLQVEVEPIALAGASAKKSWSVVPAREDTPGALAKESWGTMRAVLPLAIEAGDRVHIRVPRGWLHDFHVWLRSSAL